MQPECSQSQAITMPFNRKLIDSKYVPGVSSMMQPGVAAATASEIERKTALDDAADRVSPGSRSAIELGCTGTTRRTLEDDPIVS